MSAKAMSATIKVGDTGVVHRRSLIGNREFKGEVTQIRQSPQTIQNVVTYDVGGQHAPMPILP